MMCQLSSLKEALDRVLSNAGLTLTGRIQCTRQLRGTAGRQQGKDIEERAAWQDMPSGKTDGDQTIRLAHTQSRACGPLGFHYVFALTLRTHPVLDGCLWLPWTL